MSPELQIVLSGSLTFGVPLVMAIRELVVTRRVAGWSPDPPPVEPLPPCLLPSGLLPPGLLQPIPPFRNPLEERARARRVLEDA